MAPLAEVGGFLGGLEGLGQQVGSHFLLPPAGERPPLLGERRGAAERGARGGPGAAELAHLHGFLRRRQLYCRTGFHLQILPDGSVQGTRQDHSLFGTYGRPHPALLPARLLSDSGLRGAGSPRDPLGAKCGLGLTGPRDFACPPASVFSGKPAAPDAGGGGRGEGVLRPHLAAWDAEPWTRGHIFPALLTSQFFFFFNLYYFLQLPPRSPQ